MAERVMDLKFSGRVDGKSGRAVLLMDSPSTWNQQIKQLEGKRVEVVVRVLRSQRSLDQNAYVWGCAYPIIAEHLGYDRDEIETLHYALVEKCFGTRFDARLRMTVPNKRSSQLTTKEFSEYMEWLVRFASKELNCIVPLPNEVEVPA